MKLGITVSGGDYWVEIVWVKFTLNGDWEHFINPAFFPEMGAIGPGNKECKVLGEIEDTPNDVEIAYLIGKNSIFPNNKPKYKKIGPVPPLAFGKDYPLPVD